MLLRRILVLAALPALGLAMVTFHRQWHFHGNNVGRSAVTLPGGGFVASGSFELPANVYGTVLVRTDSLGDTISASTFHDVDQDGGFSCRLLDGGLAMLAKSGGRVLVLRFNATGESTWDYRSEWGGQVSAFIPTLDGGCLVAGRIPETASDMGAIKLAADGREEWARHYHAPFLDQSWARGAAQTRDSGYILCGDADDYLSSNLRLVRLDAAGDTAWTRLYHGPVGPRLNDVRELPDGGFLAVGYEFDTLASGNAVYMMRTTSTGSIVWTRQLAPAGASSRATAMCATRDGGFAVTGRISWGDSARAWLVRTDAWGDTLWTAILPGSGLEVANDIEQTGDGGFLVAGTSDSAGGSILLIKTDSLGGMMTGVAGERPAPAAPRPGLDFFPNPATGTVSLSLPFEAARAAVSVYDARGSMVYSGPAARASSLRLDTGLLPAGVYLVRLDTERGPLAGKLVVE